MDLQTAIQVGGLVSVAVGVASLVNGIRTIRRQMTLQIIMKYTERYEQIMDLIAKHAYEFRLDESVLPEPHPLISLAVLKYLNLCSEEFFLKCRHYFAPKVWHIWEDDMKRILSSPSHREFIAYVDGIHARAYFEAPQSTVHKKNP